MIAPERAGAVHLADDELRLFPQRTTWHLARINADGFLQFGERLASNHCQISGTGAFGDKDAPLGAECVPRLQRPWTSGTFRLPGLHAAWNYQGIQVSGLLGDGLQSPTDKQSVNAGGHGTTDDGTTENRGETARQPGAEVVPQ